MAAQQEKSAAELLGSIERKLKLFEETRLDSFKDWKFDENEKCSASEVKEPTKIKFPRLINLNNCRWQKQDFISLETWRRETIPQPASCAAKLLMGGNRLTSPGTSTRSTQPTANLYKCVAVRMI